MLLTAMLSRKSSSRAGLFCASPAIRVDQAACCLRSASIGSTHLPRRNRPQLFRVRNSRMSVLVEKFGTDLVVRFTRPERRNSLSIEVLNKLEEIVDSVAADRMVESLIFTGTGDVF